MSQEARPEPRAPSREEYDLQLLNALLEQYPREGKIFSEGPAYFTATNAGIAIVGFTLGVLFGCFLFLLGVKSL